jgi:hypothetical protein
MIWQSQTEAAYAGMKRIGVTAAAVIANREKPGADLAARTAAIRAAGLRWYVENIATDFYAPYHRYLPGEPVNARFVEAQQRWRRDPTDPTAFFRMPSLSDPVWMERIRARLRETVLAHRPGQPLFYDLGDETGIADLTAAWDFDRAPASLAAMRVWLAGRYPSLAALNAQWGTGFARWDDVVPMTTGEAVDAAGGNPSSWSDFKAWMDAAFAAAIRAGTDAVHAADPAALAGIEGAQRPGPGGYDYTRLAASVDVMEIYPDDDNLDIVHDINPDLAILTTGFPQGATASRAIWSALLRGSRGLVIWDDAHDLVLADGGVGPRGRGAAPLFAELRGPAAAALLASTPRHDPVAILYSPESDRIQWLLDRRAGIGGPGAAWPERDADIENQQTIVRAARTAMTSALRHRGLQPRWVTPAQVARGDLPAGTRVLLLPQTIALGDATIAAIRRFIGAGGTIIADGPPGQFDEHGRPRSVRPFGASLGATPPAKKWVETLIAAGIAPVVSLPEGVDDVSVRVFRRGDGLLIALLRDMPPPGSPAGNGRVAVALQSGFWVRDLRTGENFGNKIRLDVEVDAVSPTILEVSPRN